MGKNINKYRFIKVGTGFFWGLTQISSAFANSDSGYLTYSNPAVSAAPSTMSTVSYIFSLLLTFAVVVGLAYFTSKFLAQRWTPDVKSRNMVIRDKITLDVNRSLYLVEIGGKVLLLGVTEQGITCLQEYTDETLVALLRDQDVFDDRSGVEGEGFQNLFQQQIEALQRLAGRASGRREE